MLLEQHYQTGLYASNNKGFGGPIPDINGNFNAKSFMGQSHKLLHPDTQDWSIVKLYYENTILLTWHCVSYTYGV